MTAGEAPLGLCRENLSARALLILRRGSRCNPDVLLVRASRGLVVVKDYAPRSRWVRLLLGPWLLRREIRAYRALADHPAVPRYLGRIDARAIVLEHRGGPRFSRRRPWTFSPRFACALAGAVAGLHARGVAHLDLGHRSNIRADRRGNPVLIDFGSALSFRPGGWGWRLLLPLLAGVDRRALRKWERQITASQGRLHPEPLPLPRASAVPGGPRSAETPPA